MSMISNNIDFDALFFFCAMSDLKKKILPLRSLENKNVGQNIIFITLQSFYFYLL